MSYQQLVEGLAELSAVEIAGKQITGTYLAMIVAMNPELLTQEACKTPQLISELGRFAAVAYREKQRAESDYRAWRDGKIHSLTNNLEAAREAGFACVCSPGVDAKGKEKPAKLPSTTAAEAYMRTLPAYREHQKNVQEREEAWATVYAALDAAKQRTWVVKTLTPNAEVSPQERPNRISIEGAFGDNNFSGDFSNSGGIVSSVSGKTPPPPPKVRRS